MTEEKLINIQALFNRYPIVIMGAVLGLYVSVVILGQRVNAIEEEQVENKRVSAIVVGMQENIKNIDARTARMENKLDRHMEQ